MALSPRSYVFLTGPPGAGKSSVAPLLAKKLGCRHIDLDRLIEERSGKSIPRIFAEEGEARFRELEREALAALPETRAVVATGGGAVVSRANRQLMRTRGVIVGLSATTRTLVERSAIGERPLLVGDLASQLTALVAKRREAYSDVDISVSTEGRPPRQLAATLADKIKQTGAASSGGPALSPKARRRASAFASSLTG